MSKFEDELIKKIEEEKVRPLSKSYFQLAKVLFEVALVGLTIGVIFLINLSFYLPRRGMGRGGFGPGRLDMLISTIPWTYVLFGIFGIALIIWMIYRYTGAYKTKLMIIIGAVSIVALVLGFAMSISRVNERLEGRRELKQFYRGGMQGQQMPRNEFRNMFR